MSGRVSALTLGLAKARVHWSTHERIDSSMARITTLAH